jgi:hypothetical protein
MKIIKLIVGFLRSSKAISQDYSKAIEEGFRDALKEMGYHSNNG